MTFLPAVGRRHPGPRAALRGSLSTGRAIKCAAGWPGGTKVPASGAFLRVPRRRPGGRMDGVPGVWQESPARGSGVPRCGTGRRGSPPPPPAAAPGVGPRRGRGRPPPRRPPPRPPPGPPGGGPGPECGALSASGGARKRRGPVRIGRALGLSSGSGGIRTHGGVAPTHAFEACSFGRSDTLPRGTLPDGWRGHEIRSRGRLADGIGGVVGGGFSGGCRRRRAAARRTPRRGRPRSPRAGG